MKSRRAGVATWAAKQALLFSQITPLRGRGGYAAATRCAIGGRPRYPQAVAEAALVEELFRFFRPFDVKAELAGKDVLDFGSGYGGRTVEYARRLGPRSVWGVEPFEHVIDQSRQYAADEGVRNVEFLVCGHTTIPLPAESIDVVLSYDVLEHVADPPKSFDEIWRVLRPGGFAFVVFPVYFGAFSHHLDYISLLPGLHWIFSPQTLVRAVNELLAGKHGGRFGTSLQPEPALAFDGTRRVLPSLNGLGGEHLDELVRKFKVIHLGRHGWIKRRAARSASMKILSASRLPVRVLDAVTSSISCILRKPVS